VRIVESGVTPRTTTPLAGDLDDLNEAAANTAPAGQVHDQGGDAVAAAALVKLRRGVQAPQPAGWLGRPTGLFMDG